MKPKQTFRGAVIKPGPKSATAGSSFGTSLGALLGASLGKPVPTAASGPSADDVRNARVRVGREVAGRGGKGVSVITGLPLSSRRAVALAASRKTGASRFRAIIAIGWWPSW